MLNEPVMALCNILSDAITIEVLFGGNHTPNPLIIQSSIRQYPPVSASILSFIFN